MHQHKYEKNSTTDIIKNRKANTLYQYQITVKKRLHKYHKKPKRKKRKHKYLKRG